MAIYCTQCGTSLPDDAIFCLKCGKQLIGGKAQKQSTKDQDKRSMFQGNPSKSNEPQRRKESSKNKLVLVLSLVVLVLGLGFLFLLLIKPGLISNPFNQQSQTSNSTDGQTSDQSIDAAYTKANVFCNKLMAKDYASAYAIISSSWQVSEGNSVDQFQRYMEDQLGNDGAGQHGLTVNMQENGYRAGNFILTSCTVNQPGTGISNSYEFSGNWAFSDGATTPFRIRVFWENGQFVIAGCTAF